jgi:periplasmic copper chaperone A
MMVLIQQLQHRINLQRRALARRAVALVCGSVWAFGGSLPAQAHVVLAEPSAQADTYYKAVLRVGHGCNGQATTGLRVFIPADFEGAKPQPKTGWNLSTRQETLPQAYVSHGKTVTQDVVEIQWQAASNDTALKDSEFDEFAFFGRLPAQAKALWIKVQQQCVEGQNAWTQVPESGTSTKGLKSPAALLDVKAAESASPHHH